MTLYTRLAPGPQRPQRRHEPAPPVVLPLQKGKVKASNPSTSFCPQQLRMFDLNGDGKLGLSEMSR